MRLRVEDGEKRIEKRGEDGTEKRRLKTDEKRKDGTEQRRFESSRGVDETERRRL